MNLSSTKLWHALLVQVIASVAMFTRHLTGGEWVAASTLALSIYSIADVAHKKLTGGSNET